MSDTTAAEAAHAGRRTSRLVVWFVIVTAVGLVLAGGGILVVVERTLSRQAERHAVDEARLVTHALLDRQLVASDFAGSPSPARRRRLSALFARKSLGTNSRGATLYGRRGVIFTTAPPGVRASAPLQSALRGHVVSDVVSTSTGRVLRAFLPIALRNGRPAGAIQLDLDYAPIAASARRSSLLIAALLEGLLIVLCLVLVPVLARSARRMRRQVDQIDSMERADDLKSELVATVSHELRTPLAAVLGFTELLMDDKVDEETRHHHLETIHGEAQRLNGLIDEFLDLKKIEAGHFELSLEPVQLGELLAHAVELFELQSSIHTLELDLPEETLSVVADKDRIGQLVSNLLSNAIKYSPDGGEVVVSARVADGGVVRVSIIDSGLGIPRDQQDKVFGQFFRVESADTRTIRGTGLGLSLCQEIVEAHGGSIGVESNAGRGSTFWFELPASDVLECAA